MIHMNDSVLPLPEPWLTVLQASSAQKFKVGIRPEDITLMKEPGTVRIPVKIQYHEDYGSRVGYYFAINHEDVISIMRDDVLAGQKEAYWSVDPEKLHFFDAATSMNIGYPE